MEMAKKQEYESDLTEAQIDMLVRLAEEFENGKQGTPLDEVFARLDEEFFGDKKDGKL